MRNSKCSNALGGIFVIFVILLVVYRKRLGQEMEGIYLLKDSLISFNFESNEYIRHCITNEIIGKLPPNFETRPFGGPRTNATEDAKQRKASFDNIFKSKTWLSNKGKRLDKNRASGPGSTIVYAQEAMAALHTTVSHLKMALGLKRIRLLDIPCGDMVWMSRFLRTRNDIDYTGMDIVPDLIARHRDSYSTKHGWKFIEQDVVLQRRLSATYDVIFCRMMLQHLFNNDVLRILKLFSDSGSRFLMTTSFLLTDKNADLNDGGGSRFRRQNLELPPFSLAPPVCFTRDGDSEDPHGRLHYLGLWKLPLREVVSCNSTLPFEATGLTKTIYSCTRWN